MFCPRCGAPNLDIAEKCVGCQRALPKLSEVKAASVESPSPTPEWTAVNIPPAQPPYYGNPQAGVGNYFNTPTSYAAPADRVGVSSYDNYGPYTGPGGFPPPGVSGYTNNPASYSQPIDQTGVANSYNWDGYPSYAGTADRVGISTSRNNFWPRVGAYLIDQIICGFILGIVFGIPLIIWVSNFFAKYSQEIGNVCGGSRYSGNYNNPACNSLIRDIFLNRGELSSILFTTISTFTVGLVLMLAYQVLLTAHGQTLGKKVFGLKVVRADGSAPGFGTALLRQTVGYFVSNLLFGLGFLWVAFEPNNRGWHDLIAGTYVVSI